MPQNSFRFTILTATYNRAHLLPRLFASLLSQSCKDFEWIIVDDGSTDGTDALVSGWNAPFPIRYIWKTNGGKHTAFNLGVPCARGKFIVPSDSDDAWKPYALERFDSYWKDLATPGHVGILAAYACDPNGNSIKSDMCGIIRTDVMRQFPFPEYPDRGCIPEGLVWNRITRRYARAVLDEELLVVEYQPDGLTLNPNTVKNSGAFITYYRELLATPLSLLQRAACTAKLLYWWLRRLPLLKASGTVGQSFSRLGGVSHR